ncbi:MAG: nickel pincer cofactor-dependent isomerase, group 22 [Bacillota bacterium]
MTETYLINERRWPRVVPVAQELRGDAVADVEGAVRAELAAISLGERVRPGTTVAITAGSRGFPYNIRVLRAMVDEVRRLGGEPFIVPAMGSHGGATAEGQVEVLRGLGVTEQSAGCPIRSSMETVLLGRTADGIPVHADKNAMSAGAILLFNRVKLHTDFRGRVESGLTKIMVVGLGKQVGAETTHKAGLGEAIVRMAEVFLKHAPVVGGIATVENYKEEPAIIKGLPAAGLIDEEAALLRRSLDYFPRLPFNDLDVLIVDRMGKDISGNGMDTNVIGMHRRIGGVSKPDIRTIVCLELTEGGHGNALGIGLADLVPQAMADKVDWAKTYANSITTGFYGTAKRPIVLPTAEDCVDVAMRPFEPETVRLARIRDTKHLERFWVAEALLPEIGANPKLSVLGEPATLRLPE